MYQLAVRLIDKWAIEEEELIHPGLLSPNRRLFRQTYFSPCLRART